MRHFEFRQFVRQTLRCFLPRLIVIQAQHERCIRFLCLYFFDEFVRPADSAKRHRRTAALTYRQGTQRTFHDKDRFSACTPQRLSVKERLRSRLFGGRLIKLLVGDAPCLVVFQLRRIRQHDRTVLYVITETIFLYGCGGQSASCEIIRLPNVTDARFQVVLYALPFRTVINIDMKRLRQKLCRLQRFALSHL